MPSLPPFPAAAGYDRFLPLLALTLLLTVGASLLLRRFRLPALPGLFVCGFILARTGLIDLSPGTPSAELLIHMGDVGVVLLMFAIGTECTPHELRQLRKQGLSAGLLQVLLTAVVFTGIAFLCGEGWSSLIWGLIGALSSTAVSVRLFEDCGASGHPAARLSLGIALVQDLAVILALLILPGLAGGGSLSDAAGTTGLVVLKGVGFVAAAALFSRRGIPRFLKSVSRTRARDLFTLTVLALCAGIASAGQWLGLGVTIGAFAAGVAVSGSVYSHRILADIAPFRDFFLTVFFLSVGALVQPAIVADHWLVIAALTLGTVAAKFFLTAAAARAAGTPLAVAFAAAAALSGVGEFAIVLGRDAGESGLLNDTQMQIILAVTALSLSLSPFVMKAVLRRLEGAKTPAGANPAGAKPSATGFSRRVKEMQDHAILCGYGTVGQILDKGLTRLGIPVVIIELNAETVASLLSKGRPVLFADISQADTLELAGVGRARMLIVSFPHAEIARAAITIAKERNPAIMTLCRARFPHEAAMLRKLDPDNVVHDELEAGVKMLRLCARSYERDEADLFPNIGVTPAA